MPENFEWHTDEENEVWEEVVSDPKRERSLSWVVYLILGVAATAVAFYWLYGTVSQQMGEVDTAVRNEIMTAHQLVQRADKTGDSELFQAVLSGRDRAWTIAQTDLLTQDGLYNRQPFALTAVPDSAEIANLIIAPDLQAAELVFTQTYRSNMDAQKIQLQQTAVYRRGAERWLLSPPTQEFWGHWESVTVEQLTVRYPARDREVAHKLADGLQSQLVEMCRNHPSLDCPEDWQIHLRLSTKATTLVQSGHLAEILQGDPFPITESDLSLQLPAPSLVGVPLNETSYEALLRGYSALFLTAVIADRIGYECCVHGRFVQALLDRQLADMGLRSWPTAQSHPDSLVHLRNLSQVWLVNGTAQTKEDNWSAYLLTEFIQTHGTASLEMLQTTAHASDDSFWRVLHTWTDAQYGTREGLEAAWLAWLPPSVTAVTRQPSQDLQLLCHPQPAGRLRLYRYRFDLGAPVWEQRLGRPEGFMIGLPHDDGVIGAAVQGLDTREETYLFHWQNDEIQMLSIVRYGLWPVEFLANDDDFLAYNRLNRQYLRFSMTGCLNETDCHRGTYPGYPVWSPDDVHYVLLQSSGNIGYETRHEWPLLLDGLNGTEIGRGKAPVWLNETEVAFISDTGQKVTAVTIPQQETAQIVTAVDLGVQSIQFISPDPEIADLLWVLSDAGDGRVHLTLFDRLGGQILQQKNLDLRLRPHVPYDYRFSPDGRYLTVAGSDDNQLEALIHLIDTDDFNVQTIRFHAVHDLPLHWYFDWSADGQWLSVPDNDYIRLIQADTGRQSLIIHSAAECSAAAWINP